MSALRKEMAKCPNPIYAQMVDKDQMTDSDMLDFALSLAGSYFSGILLESFKETSKANMDLQRRRAVLVTAAFFGATAAFDKDGMNLIRIGDDPDTITFAVQQLVNVWLHCCKEAMQPVGRHRPRHSAKWSQTYAPSYQN